MTTTAILPRLRATGADVTLRDGRIILSPASAVPPPLLAEAKARRADLLAELANDNTGQAVPFADDAEERAAIEAEDMPVRRTRKRMVSWANPDDEPQPGDCCGCCSGALWWTSSPAPDGWACCWCHPPAHLAAGQFHVVAT